MHRTIKYKYKYTLIKKQWIFNELVLTSDVRGTEDDLFQTNGELKYEHNLRWNSLLYKLGTSFCKQR